MNKEWCDFLGTELASSAREILGHVGDCCPPKEKVFRAFDLVAPKSVKCVILGQDPYDGAGMADGLCFSCTKKPMPPSLRNILKELCSDLGAQSGSFDGDLSPWAVEGVLLLNSFLTVSPDRPGSHADLGWAEWTDATLKKLNEMDSRPVFILWGAAAKQKIRILPGADIVCGSHPSPLSANRGGFFGGKYFTKTNQMLLANGRQPVNWSSIFKE